VLFYCDVTISARLSHASAKINASLICVDYTSLVENFNP